MQLRNIVALAVSLAVSGVAFAAPVTDEGLDAKFKALGKQFFGTTLRFANLWTEEELAITKHEFGAITPEHALTWDMVEREPGVFSFDEADKAINWAVSNGKLVRGHTLVWHSQAPAWIHRFEDKEPLTAAIENHVTTIAARYAGKVSAWYVVGEPLNDRGDLRNTVFSRVLGSDFITVAFKAARKADPAAKLYIYDYNIEAPGVKVDAMVALVSKLNMENPGLIDGIASESHLVLSDKAEPAEGLEEALSTLASAEGITEVSLSELCIPEAKPEDYVRAVQACVKVEKCVGVTVWGISDTNSWRAQLSPLLWDTEYQKKPAYDALIGSLEVEA